MSVTKEPQPKVYRDEDVYVINPLARLRNEGKYAIAAFPDPVSVPVIRLDPITAAVVTMFDGRRTCAEVADISTAMVDESHPDPERAVSVMLDKVLESQTKPQGNAEVPLLLPLEKLSPDERQNIPYYRTKDFIIKPESFNIRDPKLTFPVNMLWLLTNDCQTNCQYCYMHKPPVSREELLPFDRVRDIVKEAHDHQVYAIYVSGGDAMCYPYLFEFLDLMDEYEFEPTVIATKAYIPPDMARRLAEYRYVKGIQFSIDSTVPEIADFLVQSPGFCKRIMESIGNLQKAGIELIETKTVITPYNLPTIPKLYRDLTAMDVHEVRLATYCKSGYHHKEKLFNHPDDYKWLDNALEKLKAEFPGHDIYYQNGPPKPNPDPPDMLEKTWKNRNACTAGRSNLTICANGKVVACEQMPERDEDYLGDLRTQSIEEVWNGKDLDEYLIHPPREKFKGTICYDCDEYDECQTYYGVCVRDSVIQFGSRWVPCTICPKRKGPAVRTM